MRPVHHVELDVLVEELHVREVPARPPRVDPADDLYVLLGHAPRECPIRRAWRGSAFPSRIGRRETQYGEVSRCGGVCLGLRFERSPTCIRLEEPCLAM